MADRRFSVSVFVRNAGAVLLARERTFGWWMPVVGEIAAGESPLEAAIRALHAETGLHGRFPPNIGARGAPPGFLSYEEYIGSAGRLFMDFAFVVEVDDREVSPCPLWDGMRWATRDELTWGELQERIDRRILELARRVTELPAPREPARVLDSCLDHFARGAYTKAEIEAVVFELLAEHRAHREELWSKLPQWARDRVRAAVLSVPDEGEWEEFGLRGERGCIAEADCRELERWFDARPG